MKRRDIPSEAVLEACIRFHNGEKMTPLEILMEEYNVPEKLAYSAMERDAKKGLIAPGLSLRFAWVTIDGYEYLKGNI